MLCLQGRTFPLSAQNDEKAVDDVDVETAWKALQSSPRSQLVDVRTRAEWTYVGIPDLGPVGKRPVLVEWQTFPDQAVDPRFAERLAGELKALGVEWMTTSSSFAVREAGAWLRPRQWRRSGTAPVTMSLAALKDRSTTAGIAAPSQGGRRLVCPGSKARGEAGRRDGL